MKRWLSRLQWVIVLAIASCSMDSLDAGGIIVAIDSQDLLVSSNTPGSFRVTATNPSDRRIEWGEGSSGCQLQLSVISSAGQRYSAESRACTADFGPQGLDAGQSRTEIFEWGGGAQIDGEFKQLPKGTHRLIASAGEKGESRALEVEVAF